MLTGMVNIAVFAAFRRVICRVLLPNAEFKLVCRPVELDMSRYGRQRWQETATKWQRMARWAAKMATSREDSAAPTLSRLLLRWGAGGHVWRGMRLFKVRAAWGGGAMIELKYHKEEWLSREGARGQMGRRFSVRKAR